MPNLLFICCNSGPVSDWHVCVIRVVLLFSLSTRVQVVAQSSCDIERLLQTVLSAPESCPMPFSEPSVSSVASIAANVSPIDHGAAPSSPDRRSDRSEAAIIDASDAVCRALASLDLRVEDFELISIKV